MDRVENEVNRTMIKGVTPFPTSTIGTHVDAHSEGKPMTQTLSMDKLYQKLSTVGLSEAYVRKAGLPTWWSDELND